MLTPGPEDLEAMGSNLMNPRRRTAVLHTAMRTAAMEIRNQVRIRSELPESGTA
jgi:NTE family protein